MFCKHCGQELNKETRFCRNCGLVVAKPNSKTIIINIISEWFRGNKLQSIALGGFILFILVIFGLYFYGSSLEKSSDSSLIFETNTRSLPVSKTITTQNQIASSVVNIICGKGTKSSGGSGTIITSEGVILTNAHIIPQDKDDNPTVDKCVVTLPDSQGKIKEVYFGSPLIVPYLSSRYDLAFIFIDEAYIDDEGVSHGQYPQRFPSFLETGCVNNNPRLGETVRVFGYPAISAGGYYLTITDGLVSSLPDDGTIFTSAKINHGSSGGLAVDGDGCMLGVPSMISGDENESLGVLISNEVVSEFIDKLDSLGKLME